MQTNTFESTWNSLSRHQMPQWLQEAKFGIYTTWGIFSVPAHVEIEHWQRDPNVTWYGCDMYHPAHPVFRYHRKTYGDQKASGYKDFIPQFKAEKFDPEEWDALFREAGWGWTRLEMVHCRGWTPHRGAVFDCRVV